MSRSNYDISRRLVVCLHRQTMPASYLCSLPKLRAESRLINRPARPFPESVQAAQAVDGSIDEANGVSQRFVKESLEIRVGFREAGTCWAKPEKQCGDKRHKIKRERGLDLCQLILVVYGTGYPGVASSRAGYVLYKSSNSVHAHIHPPSPLYTTAEYICGVRFVRYAVGDFPFVLRDYYMENERKRGITLNCELSRNAESISASRFNDTPTIFRGCVTTNYYPLALPSCCSLFFSFFLFFSIFLLFPDCRVNSTRSWIKCGNDREAWAQRLAVIRCIQT